MPPGIMLTSHHGNEELKVDEVYHPTTGKKCVIISQVFPCHSSSIYLDTMSVPHVVSTMVNAALEINK